MKKLAFEIAELEQRIAGWDTRVKDKEHTKAEHESKGEHVAVNWDKLIGRFPWTHQNLLHDAAKARWAWRG